MNTTPLIVQGSSALEMQPESISPDQYGDIAIIEAKKAVDAANRAVLSAKTVKITNDEEYRASDKAVSAFKTDMKGFEGKRDSLVRPFNTAVKQINAVFKDAENGFKSAISCHTLPMSAYQANLELERRAAEEVARKERERLEALAREEQRKAKEEYDRIQAEAEAARITAEQAAKKAQDEAEAAQATTAELDPFDALLAQDSATEDTANAAAEAQLVADDMKARQEAAAEIYKQSIRDSRVEVAPAYVGKITGSGSKTYTEWKYEITDPAAVPMTFRPISEAMIAAEVKQLKGETKIQGVRIYSEVIVK